MEGSESSFALNHSVQKCRSRLRITRDGKGSLGLRQSMSGCQFPIS
ncbi:hypothetical protein RMSM_02653 [Rhodopirellula maiorica SM1]|uniref:Uncharacterized protein n=1 Tax=Rhodopirellula maiorica SM1 TaxID=1265738 RepID=M5RM85_9BACT|nr:hypothetical protein RMSM_02653 [Rhodopirellula maiorica SM1]